MNDKKIKPGDPTQLFVGDKITFGILGSKFILQYSTPIVISCSGMKKKQINELKSLCCKLGVFISKTWLYNKKDQSQLTEGERDFSKEIFPNVCDYLIMESIMVTSKVIAALVCCKPIVSIRLLKKLCEKDMICKEITKDTIHG